MAEWPQNSGDMRHNRLVAPKSHAEIAESSCQRFLRIKSAARLNHPHILRFSIRALLQFRYVMPHRRGRVAWQALTGSADPRGWRRHRARAARSTMELAEQLEPIVSLGLQSGRIRSVYGPGGEQAALRLYRKLPGGRAVRRAPRRWAPHCRRSAAGRSTRSRSNRLARRVHRVRAHRRRDPALGAARSAGRATSFGGGLSGSTPTTWPAST